MNEHRYAVIMAGGKGERFWPLSTSRTPKQLLQIVGDKPLVAMTLDYLDGLVPVERTFIITNASLVEATRQVLPDFPPENIVGEPIGRDTAAACALGCAIVKARDPQGVFCVLTADHVIKRLDVFRRTIAEGLTMAEQQSVLVTMGITPTGPNTGFGYIEGGPALEGVGETDFFEVKRFVEKPNLETAEEYLAAGNYYWNSGMFMWSVATFEEAIRQFCPDLLVIDRELGGRFGQPGFAEAFAVVYAGLGRISVDFAIMEKARNIIVARGTFSWDDVGSWPALANHIEADEQGNVIAGAVEAMESRGNLVFSKERLTALIGVEDLVVVQAPHATLICARERAQDIKKLVQRLAQNGNYDELL